MIFFVICNRPRRLQTTPAHRERERERARDKSRCFLGPLNANPGYSSVGRASDCRLLQPSDGHWFDSGWPDFFHCWLLPLLCTKNVAPECTSPLPSLICITTQGLRHLNNKLDTLGIEPRASRMLSGCDTTTPCARCTDHQPYSAALHRGPPW